MGMFFHSSDGPPERPADPAVRRAHLRRIGPLFTPYKLRLGGVLLLIVVSAGLGVIPAFLLKHVLEAIGRNDTRALFASTSSCTRSAPSRRRPWRSDWPTSKRPACSSVR